MHEHLYHLVDLDDSNLIVQGRDNAPRGWRSISCGYETVEALHIGQGILTEPCHECQKMVSTHYSKEVADKLTKHNICHTCNFWREHAERANDPLAVRVKGDHYRISREVTRSNWSGFGGHTFYILFHDGRKETCSNLWSQGAIPTHFRLRLPDNAVFASNKDFEIVQPTKKAVEIDKAITEITKIDRKGSITAGVCVFCSKPATEFRDILSRKEFTISGICQTCQDRVFAEPSK